MARRGWVGIGLRKPGAALGDSIPYEPAPVALRPSAALMAQAIRPLNGESVGAPGEIVIEQQGGDVLARVDVAGALDDHQQRRCPPQR
jgi:hypothetical protein